MGNICGEFAPKLFGVFPVGYVKEKNNRAESAAVGINAAYVKLIGVPVFIGMNFTVAVLKGRMYRCVEVAAAVNGEEALSYAVLRGRKNIPCSGVDKWKQSVPP